MKVLDGLFYSNDHEWVKVEGNIASVGITDFAQEQLGEIVFVELPAIDDEFGVDEAIGAIESVKAASDVLTPISGKIVEVNEDLDDAPESVNSDPYGAWIFKIELSDKSELESLMDAAAYKEFIK